MGQGIGFKDDDGSFGFKLTDDGKVTLGNTSDDVIQVTGTMAISGTLFAGTESPEQYHQLIGRVLVDAAGTNNSELIVDGPNPNFIILNRGGTQTGKLATDGFRFTTYGGTNMLSQAYTHGGIGKIDFCSSNAQVTSGTRHKVNITASSDALRIDTDEGINRLYVQNSTTHFVSGSGALLTMGDTTVPPSPSSAAHMYSKSGEMFVMDTGGNETQISPHNSQGEWQYFSKNIRTGKVVKVNMEKMIKRLEEITGESFLEEWYEESEI